MARHVPSSTLSFAFKDAALRLLPAPPPAPESPGQLGASAAIHITAGFLGGAAALFLVYPLDFATIRMAAELRQHMKSQGVMETLVSTQRRGGLRALYRGYGVSATAIGAYKALYFGLYDTACAVMQHRRTSAAAAAASGSPPTGEHPSLPASGSGISPVAFARSPATPGVSTTPHVTPQTSPHNVASPNASGSNPHARSTSTSPGPHHGAGHHGADAPHADPSDLGLLERWAAANVVVVAASSLTYPLDVVRKRLVADTAQPPGRQQYRGLADCVAKIAQREGVRGFYRFYGYDMLLRMGGGVLLVLYDELKSHGPAGAVRRVLAGDRA